MQPNFKKANSARIPETFFIEVSARSSPMITTKPLEPIKIMLKVLISQKYPRIFDSILLLGNFKRFQSEHRIKSSTSEYITSTNMKQ